MPTSNLRSRLEALEAKRDERLEGLYDAYFKRLETVMGAEYDRCLQLLTDRREFDDAELLAQMNTDRELCSLTMRFNMYAMARAYARSQQGRKDLYDWP